MGDVLTLSREVLRSRRKRVVRAKSESMQRMPRYRLRVIQAEADADLAAAGDFFSPTTRGDCAQIARPCPHVSCKHHLYLDVSRATGAVKLNFPDLDVWDMTESCALDVADRGDQALEKVAELMNVTRERIRQMEERALARLTPAQRAILREFIDHRSETVSLADQMEEAGGGGGGAGVEDPVDWREERAQEEALDAARIGSIAGHLMNAYRMPLRVALARASEYAEEFPGKMPEGVSIEMPEGDRFVRGPMSTPPDRIVASPSPVSLPREEAYSGLEQLIDRGEHVALPVGDDPDADGLADRLVADNRPKATRKRVLRPREESPGASEPKPEADPLPARIRAALADGVARTTSEVARRIGASVAIAGSVLNRMRRRGEVTRAAPWRLVKREEGQSA